MSASSKDFFDLVKAIGESKSKQEEDRIVAEEVRCHKLLNLNLFYTYTKVRIFEGYVFKEVFLAKRRSKEEIERVSNSRALC